jgi:S1-C subfamily serine protease
MRAMVSATGGRLTRAIACAGLLGLAAGCAATPPAPRSREQVLQRILPATVQITLEQDGRRVRSGSGVVIGERPAGAGAECFVLTSGHTLAGLADPQQVYVLLDRHRGKGSRRLARVLASRDDRTLDLALLQIEAADCVAAELGTSPGLGDAIWVVAFPWGREMTLVAGVVSQLNGDLADDPESAARLMVDASVSYGASGGGVFDAATGRLVGLVEGYRTARVSFKGDTAARYIDVPVPGETYVAPLADIQRFLTDAGYAELSGLRPALAAPRR